MKIVLDIPDEFAKRNADKVAKFVEEETVTLPDGREAKANRPKYRSANPIEEWVCDVVTNNLIALDAEYFQSKLPSEDKVRQQIRQEMLLKLKGA